MPTVDELLNTSNEVTTCTVNPDTREIIVPEKYKFLGVFSDEKVTKIPFTCPKVVGNNVDLTEYNLYINYENAIGKSNAYLIEDVVVSGDNITFSWLLSRHVTLSPGVVKYSLCAKKLNGDTISNEWNTTIATGLVIQGLEATREIIEENPDIIETILSKAHAHENKSVLDKFSESEDGNPTYNGEPIGGENTIYIHANVNWTGDSPTIETTATFEQIDTAFKSGQEQILKLSYDNEDYRLLSLIIAAPVGLYAFGASVGAGSIFAIVNADGGWSLNISDITPHTHDNKSVLDKFSETDGKLQYNGSDVGLKGDKGDTGATGPQGEPGANGYTPIRGTDYWTAADKAEIVDDVLAALPTWTGGSY